VATSDTPRAHAGRLWCGAGTRRPSCSIVCSVRTNGSFVSPPATFRLGEPIRDDVEGFKIVAVSEVDTFVSVILRTPFLGNGIVGLVFLPSRRQRSGVAGCFLDELDARAEAEFGVDVGEVGLHGAR
jgi:hypothetical protein